MTITEAPKIERSARPADDRRRNARKSAKSPKRAKSDTKRAGTYRRYSVAAEGKVSDAQQLDSTHAKAKSRGYVTSPETDYADLGISGSGEVERPGYNRMLDDVRAGRIDVLIATKLDRLTRSLSDFVELTALLRAHDVELILSEMDFDSTTVPGKMCLGMLAMFAEIERDMIVERNRGTAKHRREFGHVGGVAPFGYRKIKRNRIADDGKPADSFVIDEAQAEIVRRIVRELAAGDSLRGVAARLAADNAPLPLHTQVKRKHDTWTYARVRQIAISPAIAGWRADPDEPDELIRAPWEPIVSDAEWRAMRDELSSSKRSIGAPNFGKRGTPKINLLSGIMLCGKCGTAMGPGRTNGTLRYRCHRANNPNACSGPSVIAAHADDYVIGELFKAYRGDAGHLVPAVTMEPHGDRRAAIEIELDELTEMLRLKEIDVADFRRIRRERRAEIAELDNAAPVSDERDPAVVELLQSDADIEALWKLDEADGGLSDLLKRALVRDAFPLIVCRNNSGKGKRIPIDERLSITDRTGGTNEE